MQAIKFTTLEEWLRIREHEQEVAQKEARAKAKKLKELKTRRKTEFFPQIMCELARRLAKDCTASIVEYISKMPLSHIREVNLWFDRYEYDTNVFGGIPKIEYGGIYVGVDDDITEIFSIPEHIDRNTYYLAATMIPVALKEGFVKDELDDFYNDLGVAKEMLKIVANTLKTVNGFEVRWEVSEHASWFGNYILTISW